MRTICTMRQLFICLIISIAVMACLLYPADQAVYKIGEWGSGYYKDVFIQGNYAYCTANGTKLDIIDIRNLTRLKKVASFDIAGKAMSVFVRDKYAYIADYNDRLLIVNIAKPSSPFQVGGVNTKYPGPLDVYVSGDYAYVSTGIPWSGFSSFGGSLEIFDISNPSSPFRVGLIDLSDGMGTSVYVKNNRAYVTIGTDFDGAQDEIGGLKIISIAEPSSPRLLGEYMVDWWYATDVHILGNYAYVTFEQAFMVINISDPIHPTEVGTCTDVGIGYGVFIDGHYAYVSSGWGLNVLDIDNPFHPEKIGSYSSSSSGYSVFVKGDYAYMANGRLTVLDVKVPSTPTFAGDYDTPGRVNNIFVRGNYAYIADRSSSKLIILDVAEPSAPRQVGKCFTSPIDYSFETLYVEHGYAYIPVLDGLDIINVTDPSSPFLTRHFVLTDSYATSVKVKGNYAYLLGSPNLYILDITHPSAPIQTGMLVLPSWARDLDVKGDYAYIANHFFGLQIVDVSNPSFPMLAGNYSLPSISMSEVFVENNVAYVAFRQNSESGVDIIDVSHPPTPYRMGVFNSSSKLNDIYLQGNYAYLAGGGNNLEIVNISNPALPTLTATYQTAYKEGSSVYVQGDYIYLANDLENLFILSTKKPSLAFTLTVKSSPDSGVAISVDPPDNSNKGDGFTGFTRSYDKGTIVTLTAPGSANGKVFLQWVADNEIHTGASIQVTMNANHTVTAQYGEPAAAKIHLSRTQLSFGVKLPNTGTGTQALRVDNSGSGALYWNAVSSAGWLGLDPDSGTNQGEISVTVDAAGLTAGTYTGVITITGQNAVNSPQTVDVTLNVYQSTLAPFGSFDTPLDGSTVRSSIPVTGWALDDIGVERVKIYRAEGNSLDFVGEAVFVEGARPDIEDLYRDWPNSYKAGWGYMMLTNFLPNGGNGTFTLYAIALDREGNNATLGTRTIHCDNANAVKPFGAIDTPTQGGSASGGQYINWGWALTPQPAMIPGDGSTIWVWVDGVPLGHPVYNRYREDIAALFPGYNNSNGAVGYFYLDTTLFQNGVHTIAWSARDNAGNTDGIGSRYFTIMNHSTLRNADAAGKRQEAPGSTGSRVGVPIDISTLPVDYSNPVGVTKGYRVGGEPQKYYPDEKGIIAIEIQEVERVVISLAEGIGGGAVYNEMDGFQKQDYSPPTPNARYLGLNNTSSPCYEGFLVDGSKLRPLPAGSACDRKRGIFYWQPGPGFLGSYRLVFIKTDSLGQRSKRDVRVTIKPKYTNPAGEEGN